MAWHSLFCEHDNGIKALCSMLRRITRRLEQRLDECTGKAVSQRPLVGESNQRFDVRRSQALGGIDHIVEHWYEVLLVIDATTLRHWVDGRGDGRKEARQADEGVSRVDREVVA